MQNRRCALALTMVLVCTELAFASKTVTVTETTIQRLLHAAAQNGRVPVIVGVRDDEWRPEGTLLPAEVEAQRERGRQKKRELLDSHRTMIPASAELVSVPYLVAWVNDAALRGLLNDSRVSSIEEDLEVELALTESIDKVGANRVHTRQPVAYTGAGQIIVVIDYGVDHSHPFLAERVLHDYAACFSTLTYTPASGYPPVNDTIQTPYTVCPNGAGSQIGPAPGAPYPAIPCVANDPSDQVNPCYHGTKVAGIAAGAQHAGGPVMTGVAPAAQIIPIQVAAKKCAGSTCGTFSRQSNVLYALDHVNSVLFAQYGRAIAAVNISLGFPATTYGDRATCDNNHKSFRDSIANLTSPQRDIAVVIGTGNGSLDGKVTLPSCITNSIAVSATLDDDAVASYSNTASIVDLFAPGGADVNKNDTGTPIYTSTAQELGNQGTRNDDYTEFGGAGTSFAGPHVAGAFALLRQREPSASWQTLLGYLSATGTAVSGERAYGKKRINIDLALNQIPAPLPPSNLVATGAATDAVQLSWTGAAIENATYRVRFRDSRTGAWTSAGLTPQNSFVHSSLTRGTLYQYEVATVAASGEPSAAITDYAVTRPFTDDPIEVAGTTVIRGRHVGELREVADAWRRFVGGLANAFPSYEPASGVMAASDINDVVTALNGARQLIPGFSNFSFTDPSAPTQGSTILRQHVQQLRDSMK